MIGGVLRYASRHFLLQDQISEGYLQGLRNLEKDISDGDSEKSSLDLLANDMAYGKYDEYKGWSRLQDMIMIQCIKSE